MSSIIKLKRGTKTNFNSTNIEENEVAITKDTLEMIVGDPSDSRGFKEIGGGSSSKTEIYPLNSSTLIFDANGSPDIGIYGHLVDNELNPYDELEQGQYISFKTTWRYNSNEIGIFNIIAKINQLTNKESGLDCYITVVSFEDLNDIPFDWIPIPTTEAKLIINNGNINEHSNLIDMHGNLTISGGSYTFVSPFKAYSFTATLNNGTSDLGLYNFNMVVDTVIENNVGLNCYGAVLSYQRLEIDIPMTDYFVEDYDGEFISIPYIPTIGMRYNLNILASNINPAYPTVNGHIYFKAEFKSDNPQYSKRFNMIGRVFSSDPVGEFIDVEILNFSEISSSSYFYTTTYNNLIPMNPSDPSSSSFSVPHSLMKRTDNSEFIKSDIKVFDLILISGENPDTFIGIARVVSLGVGDNIDVYFMYKIPINSGGKEFLFSQEITLLKDDPMVMFLIPINIIQDMINEKYKRLYFSFKINDTYNIDSDEVFSFYTDMENIHINYPTTLYRDTLYTVSLRQQSQTEVYFSFMFPNASFDSYDVNIRVYGISN